MISKLKIKSKKPEKFQQKNPIYIKKIENIINKIEAYIDANLNEFLQLTDSEVIHMSRDEFDNDIADYLQQHYRHDYKNVCMYYTTDNEICIENMSY